MIYLMDEDEIKEFTEVTKRNWKDVPLKDVDIGLQFNKRLKQQFELRIKILEEIQNERRVDRKSKQYPD